MRVRYLKTICGIVSHAIYQTDAGKLAPVFLFAPGESSGPTMSRSARSGPGEYAPERPPDLSGTDTDKHARAGRGVLCPPGHVTRPAGSRSPGPHRTNGNRHRTRQEPGHPQGHHRSRKPPPGARKPPPVRYRSQSMSQGPHRTRENAPLSRPSVFGITTQRPVRAHCRPLYGPFSGRSSRPADSTATPGPCVIFGPFLDLPQKNLSDLHAVPENIGRSR